MAAPVMGSVGRDGVIIPPNRLLFQMECYCVILLVLIKQIL